MFITHNSAHLFTTAFGPLSDSPPIVGIGGWVGSWELWQQPFAILSRVRRTIAYDHRGSGATFAPPDSITFDNLVDDLFAVLDAYHVRQCTLAAESAGVLTAIAAALRDPQRICRLVLVDGPLHPRAPGDDPFLSGLRHDYPATLDAFVDLCVPELGCEHIKRWGRQIVGRASQETAIALLLTAREIDPRPHLARITQPALIIHGELDALVPVQHAHELHAAIPHSRLLVLPGAGHVPTMTRPAEVAQAMSEFLNLSLPELTHSAESGGRPGE